MSFCPDNYFLTVTLSFYRRLNPPVRSRSGPARTFLEVKFPPCWQCTGNEASWAIWSLSFFDTQAHCVAKASLKRVVLLPVPCPVLGFQACATMLGLTSAASPCLMNSFVFYEPGAAGLQVAPVPEAGG